MQWSGEVSGEYKSVAFALSEAFTKGLSKTRFVVWWSEVADEVCPWPLLPRHRNSLVRAGNVEHWDCWWMGNLPEMP